VTLDKFGGWTLESVSGWRRMKLPNRAGFEDSPGTFYSTWHQSS